jgi:hypothetical protein
MRLFAGGVMAQQANVWRGERTPRERQMFLSGGDPLTALSNPWIRTAGAIFDEEGWVEGGGQLLGYDNGLAFAQLVTVTGDARTAPIRLGLGLQGAVRVFGGIGFGSEPSPLAGPDVLAVATEPYEGWSHAYASAGAGVEVGLIGSPIRLRVDVPFVVADPELATRARAEQVGFRYTIRLIGYR